MKDYRQVAHDRYDKYDKSDEYFWKDVYSPCNPVGYYGETIINDVLYRFVNILREREREREIRNILMLVVDVEERSIIYRII